MGRRARALGVTFYPAPEVDHYLQTLRKGARSQWINEQLLKHIDRLPDDRHYDEQQVKAATRRIDQYLDELSFRLGLERHYDSPEGIAEREEMAAILAENEALNKHKAIKADEEVKKKNGKASR